MSYSSSLHNSLKFKLWRSRMTVMAPKMSIKSELPMPVRFIAWLLTLGMLGIVGYWGWMQGFGVPGLVASTHGAASQIAQLQEQVEKLTHERDQYSTSVNASESKMSMQRSTEQQLAAQLKQLESENMHLKEDLAFFESLLPTETGSGLSIRRIKVDPVASNQLHYQLLVMQGGKGDHDFVGNVVLNVNVVQNGKSAMIAFPEQNATDSDTFKLSFKHYQRLEGTLTLPDGAVAKNIQARVMEKGVVRAQLNTNL